MITIKTNHGDISIELLEEAAPISCENFRQYVRVLLTAQRRSSSST
jgi:cyclophilin family peptidyl-prolyl cis-trans isomerase